MAGIIAVTEERKQEVLFTEPLFNSYVSVYTLADYKKINIDDIKNLRIGVGKGYYTESLLKNKLMLTNYIAYADIDEAILALKEGEIDAIFENQQYMENILIKNAIKGSIIAQITNLYPRPHAYAVSKNKPELVDYMNSRIRQLKKNGVFEEIYVKYFYTHSDDYNKSNNTRNIIIIIVSVILAGAIFIFMQRMIKRLGRNLKDSLKRLSKANEELTLLAYKNSITGLPNKNKFKEVLTTILRRDRSARLKPYLS